jgi:2-dehydropantoate 2-reductase
MRILVVGAGATGGYFGARLVQAGRDVTFLVRPGRARQLASGLHLVGPHEDVTIPVRTVTADTLAGPFDLVILTVKAGALPAVADQIAPLVGAGALVLPFLNGMAHLRVLNDRFGPGRVLGGSLRVVTFLDGDGSIRQVLPLADMVLGAQPGGPADRMAEVGDELAVPGYDLQVTEDVLGAMWHKWAFITAVGVATLLMRAPLGDIVACPGGEEFIRRAIAEADHVARLAGFPVSAREHEAVMTMTTQPGSPFVPSLYRDVTGGAEHEGEHLLGDFVATARTLGAEVPQTESALRQIRAHDRSGAGGSGDA